MCSLFFASPDQRLRIRADHAGSGTPAGRCEVGGDRWQAGFYKSGKSRTEGTGQRPKAPRES